jgi:hypothetical protein
MALLSKAMVIIGKWRIAGSSEDIPCVDGIWNSLFVSAVGNNGCIRNDFIFTTANCAGWR